MKIFLIILLLIKCIYGLPRVDPLVETAKGFIRGVQSGDGDYAMFLGVPYAVVDENNPFGAASPHPGFDYTFEAYQDNILCPQYQNGIATGTLQCLQLNIYVPNSANSAHTLPVMVYLHGGAYVGGHKSKADLQPTFLFRHDVIIVTLNYRVGPYGFLCLSEPGYNNQGLKDQILGIKWVKDNIAAFGGDANRITVFGQSAGGITLDLHLLATEGLIKRAIVQSGSALNTWVIATQNDSIPLNIAAKLGFGNGTVKEAMDFLSTIDPLDLITTVNEVASVGNGHPITRPCVETVGEDALLKDFPVNLSPKVKNLEIMIGHTNKEAMFMYADNSNNDFYRNYNFEEELQMGFDEIHDLDTVKHFYIGDKMPSEELQSEILDYASDFAFCHTAERTVQRYLAAGAKKVFKYVFSYEGGRNRGRNSRNFTSSGASHGDDTSYLFDRSMFKDVTPSEDDQKIIDAMTTMWTNFAKYGDPTPSITEATPVKWLPSNDVERPYLSINKPITLEYRVFQQRMAFWDLYYKLHADKIKGIKKK